MKLSLPRRTVLNAASILFMCLTGVSAQDVTVDKLLNKLPPPETLAKPPVERALQQTDPAVKDPLVKQIIQELLRRRPQEALTLTRKLTERYPQSYGAACLRGAVALVLEQFGEAAGAFHTATTIAPRLPLAHFELGVVEARQGRFAAAIPHFQHLATLEPKLYLSYFALSDCAWRLGRKQESLDYARKSTA